MRSIVSKGKDVTEAMNIGIEELKTSKKEVHIEVLQTPKEGFFGIGSKKAVVKVTKKEDKAVPAGEKSSDGYFAEVMNLTSEYPTVDEEKYFNHSEVNMKKDDTSGKVWVNKGQLNCTPGTTQLPMVTVKEGVELYRNQKLVIEKKIFISPEDTYQLKVKNEVQVQESQWSLKIDKRELTVHLTVEPGYHITREVKDMEAAEHIELAVTETKEIVNTLSQEKVINRLKELSIKHDINEIELIKALRTRQSQTFEIVTGIPPTEGKNGWIELKVKTKIEDGLKENEFGRINFRESKTIPTVEIDDIIAIIHPPVQGSSGYTVTYAELPAKQVYPLILREGRGIKVVDDQVIATEFGRPKIDQKGKLVNISIMDKLLHDGDVNLASGNIHFSGDIEITGEIENGMVIESQGDIHTAKNINMSTCTASGAIVSRGNINKSDLSAGKNNMLVTELGQLLGVMQSNTERMFSAIKQLTNKSTNFAQGGLQPLIRILLEEKFKDFTPLARKYVELVKKNAHHLEDDRWQKSADSISKLFLTSSNGTASIQTISNLLDQMQDLLEVSGTSVESESYVHVLNVLNSHINCSGNVLIEGRGCVNSKIHSGGYLKIRGILRGGEVYARLDADINETGASSGTLTTIAVSSDQKIKINKAKEGTVLKFGKRKHVLTDDYHLLVAKLNEHGDVIFE